MNRITTLFAALVLTSVPTLAQLSSADEEELLQHIRWAIAHEGCFAWSSSSGDPASDTLAPAHYMRNCFVRVQHHNAGARGLMARVNDTTLERLMRKAADSIRPEIPENFGWVAYHEGMMNAFRIHLANGDFHAIRTIYRQKQSHNENAVNLLSAVPNSYLRDLINGM